MSRPTTRHRSRTPRIVAVLFAVAAVPACVPLCPERQPVACQHAGSVAVASPTYALPAIVEAVRGFSCLALDGTCSAFPYFTFQSPDDRPDGHSIFVSVELSPSNGPGTYHLTDDDRVFPRVHGALDGRTYSSGFRVVSGTLIVSRSDREGLQASVEMELESLDAQHVVSLTGGLIDVSGCYVGDAELKPCANS